MESSSESAMEPSSESAMEPSSGPPQVQLKWPPLMLSKKPKGVVWRYFIEKKFGSDAIPPYAPYWTCMFCDAIYTSKHATRMRSHIMKCPKASDAARTSLKNILKTGGSSSKLKTKRGSTSDGDYENSDDDSEIIDSPDPQQEGNAGNSCEPSVSETSSCPRTPMSSLSILSDSDGQSSSSRSSTPRSSFREPEKRGGLYNFLETMSSNEKRTLDQLFAKAVYSSGVPFQTLTENEEWKSFFKRLRPSFKLPNRQQLAGALLNDEYARVQETIEEKLEGSAVLCLQCDGWSNVRNEAIVNFIISTPQPVFYKSIETKLSSHSADYFFGEIDHILQKIGVNKFQACITDNAANMIASTSRINQKYPHITGYTCAAHSINLLVQDILKIKAIKEVTDNCLKIVKAVTRSQILKALFMNIQEKENVGNAYTLVFPAKTRWTSWRSCLQSLRKTAYALKLLCINEKTKVLLKPDVRELILSEEFWNRVEVLHNLIDVAGTWTVRLQDDTPCISSVFKAFVEIESSITENLETPEARSIFSKAVIKRIAKILTIRKKKGLRPIHLASYLLDPKYRGTNFSPNQDLIAMQFLDAKIRETFTDNRDILQALDELANFKCQTGFFAKPFVVDSAKITPPLTWWKGTCSSTKLKQVAEKILSLPATTAATERSFSVHGFIHNAKRNRLKADSAAKVTCINYNLRLSRSKSRSRRPIPKESGGSSHAETEESQSDIDDPEPLEFEEWTRFPVEENEDEDFDIESISVEVAESDGDDLPED